MHADDKLTAFLELERVTRESSLELKHVEQFEDDDDNDNNSDDVENASVHGSWVTRRYLRRQAIYSSRV